MIEVKMIGKRNCFVLFLAVFALFLTNKAIAGLPGDVDESGSIDLKDTIIVLQLGAGMTPSSMINADVNNDGKLGLEEAIFDLQVILRPVLKDTLNLSVLEGSEALTPIGRTTIESEGDSEITKFEFIGEGDDNFYIDQNGFFYVSRTANLDFETKSNYTFSVKATNDAGVSNTVTVFISIIDTELPPVLIDSSFSISENSPAGAFVGSLGIKTEGDSAITGFLIYGNSCNLFKINLNGDISVAFDNMLDFEKATHYNLEIEATNSQGTSRRVKLDISIEDIVTPVLIRHIVPGDASAYDFLGNALSFLDDQLFIGAKQDDYSYNNNDYRDAGSVYIYNYLLDESESEQSPLRINNSDIRYYNLFGSSIASGTHSAHGDIVLVGIEGISSCDGQVRLYRENINGLYSALNVCEDSAAASDLGRLVALSEDFFVAAGNKVHLFSYDQVGQYSGQSSLIQQLQSQPEDRSDYFPNAISVSGNTILVASQSEDNHAGAVYLYKFSPDNNQAELVQIIHASDQSENANFGTGISIDGTNVVITSNDGFYLFKIIPDGSLVETHKTDFAFGREVIIKDDTIIISAPGESVGVTNYAGAVHLYKIEDNVPVHKARLTASLPESSAAFGDQIALHEHYLAISATAEDNGASATGAVYLYDLEPQSLPVISNFKDKIDFKDNADFTNIAAFDTNSLSGGPFTYSLSGTDADNFVMNGNVLEAIQSFDMENPADHNGDNDYYLVVTVSDSAGYLQQYTLNIAVWKHEVMYYQYTKISDTGAGARNYGTRMGHGKVNDTHYIFIQEQRDEGSADNYHTNLYRHHDDHLELMESIIAPEVNFSLYDEDNYLPGIERGLGQLIAMDGQYLVLSSSVSAPNYGDPEIQSILLYQIQEDGSLSQPYSLPMQADEKSLNILDIEIQGQVLLVSLEYKIIAYKIIMRNQVYRIFESTTPYATHIMGASINNFLLEGINENEYHFYKIDIDLEQVQHMLTIPQDSEWQIIKMFEDIIVERNPDVDIWGGIDIYRLNNIDNTKDFINSFDITIESYANYLYNDNAYLDDGYFINISHNEDKVSIYNNKLALGDLEYYGSLQDSKFDNVGKIMRIDNYLYFSDILLDKVYVYKLDEQ
jgi:hypothetical protein